jgi:hypothetical protein
MVRRPSPPIAAAISFIDCINRGDLEGLTELMTDDHALVVLDEPALVGRDSNRDAGSVTTRLSGMSAAEVSAGVSGPSHRWTSMPASP